MNHEDNMAPGQQNAPEEGKIDYRPDPADGQDIVDGAREEDQIAALNKTADEAPSQQHVGASPTKDTLSQEDINNGINSFAERDGERNALETPEGKNNGAKPAAYNNQQSYHP